MSASKRQKISDFRRDYERPADAPPSVPYIFSKPSPSPPKEPTSPSNGPDENPAGIDTGAGDSNDTDPQLEDISTEHEHILAQMVVKGTLPVDNNGTKNVYASFCSSQTVAVVHVLQHRSKTSSLSSTNILLVDSKSMPTGFHETHASHFQSVSAKTSLTNQNSNT